MPRIEPTQRRDETPIINITGERVALGPVTRDLLPPYLRWMNDLKSPVRPSRPERWEEWYDWIGKDQRGVVFAIYERAAPRPIGTTGLYQIDHHNRTADFSIVVGEKDCWGKGYGTEATRLVLDYGFTALGLHNIMLSVAGYNERPIRAYTRAGFRVIGRRREAGHLGARAYDQILMDYLAPELESPILDRLLPDG